MAKYSVKSAMRKLSESSNNMSCSEMRKILEDLGYTVKRGANGNHHSYSHPKLPEFFGGNYDCGHNAHLLPVYPRKVLKVLTDYKAELEAL